MPDMHYRRLGRAGLKVSALGLGTWLNFGRDQEADNAVVDAAIGAGINFFDTANTGGRGAAETALGKALARHDRDPLVVATKVWGPMGDGPNLAGLSRKHIVQQCEASLRRLGVERIDLYQCQRYDPETMLEETLRAMDDLVHQGKVLYWGVSAWTPLELGNTFRLTEAQQLYPPASVQVRHNLLDQTGLAELAEPCRRHGMGMLAYSPLAQGVLSGKYFGAAVPEGSRWSDERRGANLRQRYKSFAHCEPVDTLLRLASGLGVSAAQVALAWVLKTDGLSAAIMGASTPEQVAENVGAIGLEIPFEMLDALRSACG